MTDTVALEDEAVSVFDVAGAGAAAAAVLSEEADSADFVDVFPANEDAAASAIDALNLEFKSLPAMVRKALRGAGKNAANLSHDRLQGLAELIQNADDVGATEVRFAFADDQEVKVLWAAHNGRPLRLRDVVGLATPWLSLKDTDASAVGRFGIGLMTLRALSDTLHVHQGHFHVQLTGQTLTRAPAENSPPADFAPPGWTVFAVPLRDDVDVDADDVAEWFALAGDASMLFLRSILTITCCGTSRNPGPQLGVSRSDPSAVESDTPGGVQVRTVAATDRRQWAVYSTRAPTPARVHRAEKAHTATTPVDIAFPVGHDEDGWVHVGLPVRKIGLPFRVSAEFDPLGNRGDLADTTWNVALVGLVSQLWLDAARHIFSTRPSSGWAAVPIAADLEADEHTQGRFRVALEEHLLTQARGALASGITFTTWDGQEVGLSELAAEDEPLTGILEPADIAGLAGTCDALPIHARDAAARWRTVLFEFAGLGAPVPVVVHVANAVPLLGDGTREPDFKAALTAAVIKAGYGASAITLECLVTEDGSHVVPPSGDSPQVIVDEDADPLWAALGMGVRIHSEYAGTADWPRIAEWLSTNKAMTASATEADALERLCRAGHANMNLHSPLTDQQAEALRQALESMPDTNREALGAGIGKAVLFDATTYDSAGHRNATHAHPGDAYLIERDAGNWSVAAGHTPGLVWLHRRYSKTLRTNAGPSGVGSQRLFRLLGAETAPRLRPHPAAEVRYSGAALGVPISTAGSPSERTNRFSQLDATYTLNDHDSPDLESVLVNIVAERNTISRRKRAAAVLTTLAKAWDRLEGSAHVTAAVDYYGWNNKGSIPAWWMFQAAGVPWLTNGRGAARKPNVLRRKTMGNLAAYGPDPSIYLDADLDTPNKGPLLEALGVAGDPPVSEFIRKLEELRNTDGERKAAVLMDAAAPLYLALADQVHDSGLTGRRGIGNLSTAAARRAFSLGQGLVITELGWRIPSTVLAGPPIFGDLRPFVPAVNGTDRLWRILGISPPSAKDAVSVLRELAQAKSGPSEHPLIMLEALRLLAVTEAAHPGGLDLAKLPLWTTQGWTNARPVYYVNDPQLSRAAGVALPVWQPGGDLTQFAALLRPLKLTPIDSTAATVQDPDQAEIDDEATHLYRNAVALLKDDLILNDPIIEKSIRVTWDDLAGYCVATLPGLRVSIDVSGTTSSPAPVAAHLDASARTLYVSAPDLAGKTAGGHSVASMFNSEPRRVAQQWIAAWVGAEEGQAALNLQLAARQAEQEAAGRDQQNAERLEKLAKHANRTRGGTKATASKSAAFDSQLGPTAAPKPRPTRNLIDPDSLTLTNPDGKIVPATTTNSTSGHASAAQDRAGSRTGLRDPDRGNPKAPSQRGKAPVNYTPEDRETIGMRLVMRALGDDSQGMIDIRNQHGVGADAVSDLRQFFELKVHAHAIPDQVRLTPSEVERARATDDYFLVVVGNVEDGQADPEVRFITDPLGALTWTLSGITLFGGVRDAPALVYTFGRDDAE